jgi:DNA-binding XRE family transcriptional regulator/quercetin dioxygenase-like cupin family protein
MKVEEIGTKIRIERKKSGLTLKQLAKKAGISAITLQRIETGKSSPSVVLLSEIANVVNKPIFTFFEQKTKPFVQIKRKNQRSISSPMLKIKLIGPRKMLADNIVVTYGELKKGKRIDLHTNDGIEFNYNIEGKAELNLGGQCYYLEAGDSSVFNARLEHSVAALEKLKFFGIFVEDKQ